MITSLQGRSSAHDQKGALVGQLPIDLILPVVELRIQLEMSVRSGRWLDAALSAAGMWQAADDALARTSSPLARAANRARERTDPMGRSLSSALERAQRLAMTRPSVRRDGGRQVDHWRAVLMEVAVASATLALPAADTSGGDGTARRAAQLLDRLADVPRQVQEAVNRIPSCFRPFDQHPDDVVALVEAFTARWPDRARPVVVVGVRTSGNYLAPFAVASLRRAGFRDISMVSARPDQQHLPIDARTLRTAARKGAAALVIDDPPTSGESVALVCADLVRIGFPHDAVVPALAVFDDLPRLPESLSSFPAVALPRPQWSIQRRLAPERVVRDLATVFSPMAVRLDGELPAPTGLLRSHAGRLYRIVLSHGTGLTETRTVLAAGTGLGYFGDHDVAVAHALKDRVPAVIGRADGVVYLDWPSDAPPVRPSPSDVVEYVCARSEALAVDSDPTARLRGAQPVWEVASAEVARAYGRFWPVARLAFADRMARTVLQAAHPSVPDGDMRPITWYTDPRSGRAVKTSFAARTFSNFDLVCFDDRFDIVGAAVHTDDAQYSRDLRTAYESHSGRTISHERWLLYELVHLWDLERLGLAAPEAVSNRKSRAVRRYLAEVLLADVAEVAHGPVVALDVDGVLETDLLGFKAPTPTAALCLRALAVHGYRTVLATGRCLDDVVELSELFGLAGGIAEYGSVVYDRRAASTTPLVDGTVLEALARLRQPLLSDASVHVDMRYRFSVRASTLVGRQELHTYVPPPSIVPRELKAIAGEGQTDFIGAHIDKAHGGRELLRGLHEQAPVLAVGDTVADVGLLSWATHSVVPRHADTPAKAAADRVARSPYQAGLAAAVSSLIGHRPGGCARCALPDLSTETRTMLELLRLREGSRLQAALRAVSVVRSQFSG